MSDMTGAHESNATLRISVRLLATSAALVALASLATLVVVVSLKDIDALSTVALALAILAFVVQLIVFIVQAADASRQSAQGQALHAQLMSMLSELRERTQGTQQSVDKMNTRLLEAVIGKATNAGLDAGTPEFAAVVASGLDAAPQGPASHDSRLPGNGRSVDAGRQGTLSSLPALGFEEASRLHAEMETWPSEREAQRVQTLVSELSDQAVRDLHRLSRDLFATTVPPLSLGPGLPVIAQRELLNKGLIERISPESESLAWYTLSPSGRVLGRLFTALGQPPAHLREVAEALRARAEDLEERRKERLGPAEA